MYQTVLGWTLVPLPTCVTPKEIDFTAQDTVAATESPFTKQSQTYQWPGADWWEITVSYAPMKMPYANQFIAWLMSMRGKANAFMIGDPLGIKPQGRPAGTPTVSGIQYPMVTQISTKGWAPNRGNLLLPGDYIQLGYRLHRAAWNNGQAVQSDANGNATIEIWPSIREQVADGTPLILTNAQGLFRLSDNNREWTARETKVFGISFKAAECR